MTGDVSGGFGPNSQLRSIPAARHVAAPGIVLYDARLDRRPVAAWVFAFGPASSIARDPPLPKAIRGAHTTAAIPKTAAIPVTIKLSGDSEANGCSKVLNANSNGQSERTPITNPTAMRAVRTKTRRRRRILSSTLRSKSLSGSTCGASVSTIRAVIGLQSI